MREPSEQSKCDGVGYIVKRVNVWYVKCLYYGAGYHDMSNVNM